MTRRTAAFTRAEIQAAADAAVAKGCAIELEAVDGRKIRVAPVKPDDQAGSEFDEWKRARDAVKAQRRAHGQGQAN